MALSNWLETPLGYYTSMGVFTIIPGVAVIFHFAGRVEVAIKLTVLGDVVLTVVLGSVFWVCGSSLKRVIDESLRLHTARIATAGVAATADGRNKNSLVAVRKKATRMTNFIVQQVCVRKSCSSRCLSCFPARSYRIVSNALLFVDTKFPPHPSLTQEMPPYIVDCM